MFDPIGLIGVGNMGTPMTRRLVEAGYQVVAFDIDPEALERAYACGAEIASSPMELAEQCNTMITILPNSDSVEQVVLGSNGILEGGSKGDILIEMTTAYPLSTQKIARRLKERGIRMLDAPVSGGVEGAQNGTLSIMVGGDKELME
ncbi:MAG: NAD(P)-dependent oxidoreductase [Candidatus Bathyarchaeia archaeon]